MKELFNATIYRVRKSTGIKIGIAITYLAAIGYYVLAVMIAKGSLDASQTGSVTGLGDAMIIWLFGALITGVLIGSDFESKTIHGAIGHGRKNIIVTYVAVYLLLIVLLILPYTIGSIILLISGKGIEGAEGAIISIYLSNVKEYSSDISMFKLVLSYVAQLFIYLAQLSICIPVAIKIKKTVVVTAFGFFFGMVSALLSTLASKVKILDNIYRLTPYNYGIDKLGINAATTDMLMAIIISIVFIVLMGLLSWLVFRKSDIK